MQQSDASFEQPDALLGRPAERDSLREALPRFSIVVPAYNAEQHLAETLASVASQTVANWECIVVDDGSVDATFRIAQSFSKSDPRFRAIRQENAGCSAARNSALRVARGEFICLLDADDLYDPGYLELQAAFIDARPGFDLYSCNGLILLPNGATTPYFTDEIHEQVVSFTLEDWFPKCPVLIMSILRREAAEAIGGFREDLRHAEDYDFWLRLMASGARHLHNPAVLCTYRRHGGGKSTNRSAEARAVAQLLEYFLGDTRLTHTQRERLERVLERRTAAIVRREMEERFERGDFRGARRAFWGSRRGYADRAKFWAVLPMAMLSPRLYTRLALRG
ncbi:MAG: glycosyltransferase [Coriobacteriia bacterium]